MWTTVFTEEEEKSDTDMEKGGKRAESYAQAADVHHQIIAVIDGHCLLLLVIN